MISILRFIFTLISLLILWLACWLLWNWYHGEVYRTADGAFHLVRQDWRAWLGGILLAWSFLGRLIVTPLLARRDDAEPTRPERSNGQVVTGAAGGPLYVETHGSSEGSPTLILTHGWGLDSTAWFYAKREFSKRFKLLVWDLPGMGKSRPNDDVSLDRFATDLNGLVGSVEGPVVLVGHSIGGMTIQTLAKRNPELFGPKVIGIVLLNTTYTNPLKTMILHDLAQALRPVMEVVFRLQIWLQALFWLSSWQSYLSGSTHMANRIAFGPKVTRSQLGHTSLLTTRNPPGAQARGNLAMFRWDASDALATIPVPVLVIGGGSDIVTKPIASERMAKSAPRGNLHIVDRANHMSFLDDADTYHKLIATFLAKLPVPRSN